MAKGAKSVSGVAVVYQRKERVTVEGYDGRDYLVRDESTGRTYLVDEHYFRRLYEAVSVEELIPVHTELWDKLDEQARELYQMKRANINLRNNLRVERKRVGELHKERAQRDKQHLRKGQKRGKHGRNG